MVKIVIALAVMVALGAGAYYWYESMQPAPTQAPVADVQQNTTPAQPQTTGVAAAVAASGQTDEALASDAASIDSEIQAFSSDNADINSSMSDQPVQQ